MGALTDEMTVNAYKMAYAQGYDHSYPNENIVRLELHNQASGNTTIYQRC